MYCPQCHDTRPGTGEPCPECQVDPPPDADYQMLNRVHSGIREALKTQDASLVVHLANELSVYLSADVVPQLPAM